jgi:hypothetical protein
MKEQIHPIRNKEKVFKKQSLISKPGGYTGECIEGIVERQVAILAATQ